MSEQNDQGDQGDVFKPQWENARAFATPAAVSRLPEYASWRQYPSWNRPRRPEKPRVHEPDCECPDDVA